MKEQKEFPDYPALSQKLRILQNTLVDQKAEDPFTHIWGPQHSIADAILIVTAGSARHARGLADHLLAACRAEKYEFLRMEGYEHGQWIVLDCNDIMVHIFSADTRALYRLEDMCVMRGPIEKEIDE